MPRLLLAAAVLALPVAGAFEVRPLPATCRPVVGENLTWDTRSFRIISEVPIPEPHLKRLASVADSTVQAVRTHPVDWFDPPRGTRPELRIFRDARSYEQAGGTPGTAGWYLWRQAAVGLNAEHLFPETPPGSRLGALPDEAMLVHEIVHLCMHGSLGRLPQWFSEGVCEYYAAGHLGAGRFDFRSMDRRIREHLKRRFGAATEAIPALKVSEVSDLDHRAWLRFMLSLEPERRYEGYVTALLLTHYHLHGSSRRRGIAEWFTDPGPKAPENFGSLADQGAELERAFLDYWRPKGLTLSFKKAVELEGKP